MLELLVVFTLASIGIYFTTTGNDPHPEGSSRGNDGYEDEGAGRDEGGIGVLGIDVGRKSPFRRLRRSKSAPASRPVDDTEIEIVERRGRIGGGAATVSSESVKVASRPVAGDAMLGGDDRAEAESGAHLAAGQADDPALDDAALGASIRSVMEENAGAPGHRTAHPAWREEDGALDRVSTMLSEEDRIAGTDPARDPAMPKVDLAGWSDDDDDEDADEIRAMEALREAAAVQQDGPPVIEDFDPAEDQIVIGYHNGEAGDGRIGISEDPKSPGTALVTLGGLVVAVVPDGFGKVRAHHIDLYLLDDAA